MLDKALEVIDEFHSMIPAVQVLEILPDYTPVNWMDYYFKHILRDNTSQRRHCQIKKNLIRTYHRNTRLEGIGLQCRPVFVGQNSRCEVNGC